MIKLLIIFCLFVLSLSNKLYSTELDVGSSNLEKQFWEVVASVESSLSNKDEVSISISKMNDIYERMLPINNGETITFTVVEFNIKYLSLYGQKKAILDYYKNNVDKLEPTIYYYRYKLRYLMMLYILDTTNFAFELEKLKTQSKNTADKSEFNKYLAFFNLIHRADSISYNTVDEVCNSKCESYPYFHLSKMEYYKRSHNIRKLVDYSSNRVGFLTESGIDVDNIYEFLYSLSYLAYSKSDGNLNELLSEYKKGFDVSSEIVEMMKWIESKESTRK